MQPSPFLLAHAVVVLVTFFFGLRPGVLALLLSLILSNLWLIPPLGHLNVDGRSLLTLALFTVVGGVNASMVEWLRRVLAAQRRLYRDVDQARARADLLAAVSAALADSLEPEAVAAGLLALATRGVTTGAAARRTVTPFAGWGLLVLSPELPATAPRCFAAHQTSALQPTVEALARGIARARGAATALGQALHQHAVRRWDAELSAGLASDAHAALTALASIAVLVPLQARGRHLGALLLGDLGPIAAGLDLPLAEALGQRVAQALDNAALHRQAQRAVALRDDFMAMAGHELRTPLAVLTLQCDTLQRALARGASAAEGAERVQRMKKILQRLGALVNQLMDVSLVAEGRLSLRLEDFDLAALAAEVAARFEETAAQAGSPLVLDATPEPGRWDRFRLDQVLTNLIGNALKYGAGQPVRVVVRAGEGAGEGSDVIVQVQDEGPGIAPADQERVFERFERAAATSVTGLGLGLWIARKLVVQHGGSLTLQSAPGRGATFIVRLPRDSALAPADEVYAERPAASA